MQRSWATDGNRKWAFRTPGQWSLQIFKVIVATREIKDTLEYKCGSVKKSSTGKQHTIRGSKTLHA